MYAHTPPPNLLTRSRLTREYPSNATALSCIFSLSYVSVIEAIFIKLDLRTIPNSSTFDKSDLTLDRITKVLHFGEHGSMAHLLLEEVKRNFKAVCIAVKP